MGPRRLQIFAVNCFRYFNPITFSSIVIIVVISFENHEKPIINAISSNVNSNNIGSDLNDIINNKSNINDAINKFNSNDLNKLNIELNNNNNNDKKEEILNKINDEEKYKFNSKENPANPKIEITCKNLNNENKNNLLSIINDIILYLECCILN